MTRKLFFIVLCATFELSLLQEVPYDKFKLITSFNQTSCTLKSTKTISYYLHNDTIPKCLEYQSKGTIQPVNSVCPPAYKKGRRCSKGGGPCETNADCTSGITDKCQDGCTTLENACMAYHAYTVDYGTKQYTASYFKPTCLDDGSWAPKQCKGGQTGKCLCYGVNGTRLFGEALFKDAKDMTCACSRKKEEIKEKEGRNFVGLHCDSKGNFEPLQCDNGQCWCAEPKTGKVVASVVPEKTMKFLPCYNSGSVGDQYLRQCESQKYAKEVISEELKIHGVLYSSFGILVCDDDGAYGPYIITGGRPYCILRNGTKTIYQDTNLDDLKNLNCYCARDAVTYGSNMLCKSNGNYYEIQTIETNGNKYCVDTDGFQKSPASATVPLCENYY